MRFTEHAILRRVAAAAKAHFYAVDRGPAGRGRPVKSAAELGRWLTVLEAWDAEHTRSSADDTKPGELFETENHDDGRSAEP